MRLSPRQVVGPGASLVMFTAVLATAAISNAAFNAPVELSGVGAFEPQVALDADGDGLVVWKGTDGAHFRAQARARSAAGAFGSVELLSPAGRSAFEPQVAVDSDGDALAVWRRRDGTGACSSFGCFRVQARARSAAGVLGPIQTLSPPDQDSDSPRVAVDGDGDAFVVWRRAGVSQIQGRARSAAGVLGPVRTLSPAGESAFGAEVAIDAEGDALAVWYRSDGTSSVCCERIQARPHSAAGTLGTVRTLSAAGQDAQFPNVATDADGDSVVVWRRYDGSGLCASVKGCHRVQARPRSAAGALGGIQTLSGGGRHAGRPQVAVDADGDALVVWGRSSDGAIQARARSAAGILGSVESVSPAGPNAVEPRVAIEADGDAVIVWGRSDGANVRIQARTHSAAGALGALQTLSAAGEDAGQVEVAADMDADALAVWRFGPAEGSGCCARIHAAAGP